MISPTDILALCKTKQEANLLQQQLEDLLLVLFTNRSFEEIVEEKLSYEKKNILFILLQKNTVDTTKPDQIQIFLQEIKKVLSEIPIVSLTLAFSPKKTVIETISTWFAVHIKRPVLLDITVNTALLGGAIISYNGLYKDYSVKHILEEKYKQGDIRFETGQSN